MSSRSNGAPAPRTRHVPGAVLPVAALLLSVWAGVRLGVGDEPVRLARDVAGVDVGLYLDVLSVILLAFVASLSWLVASYAGRNMVGQAGAGRLGRLHASTTLGLALLVTGASLPVIAVGWTVSGLSLAAMVAHAGTPAAGRAARYVRRVLLTGDAALWMAVAVAVVALPTVDRAELASARLPPVATTVVALLLVLACVPRSALVPAHRWLPETAEAPSPVSALLHAGIVNGAVVLLTLMWPVVSVAPAVLCLLLLLGAVSVVWGTVGARLRTDAKGRLAASTTAQMGFTAVQLGLGLPAAAVLHVLGHGLWKSWLFLRAGGTATRLRMEATGATSRPPLLSVWVPAVAVSGVFLLGWVPLSYAWSQLGPVVLVPLLLTVAAVSVAAWAADSPQPGRVRAGRGVRVAVGGLVSVAGAAYLWGFAGAELLLSPVLPPTPVWSPAIAVVLVVVLLGFAAVVLLLLRQQVTGRPGPLVVLMTGEAVAPWDRRLGGTRTVAASPRTASPQPHSPERSTSWDGGGEEGTDTTGRVCLHGACTADIEGAVAQAAQDLAPAWPLRTVVAANPLAGLERVPFEEAARAAVGLVGTDGLLPGPSYARHLRDGRIRQQDLAAAVTLDAADAGRTMTPPQAAWVVEGLMLAGRWGAWPATPAGASPATVHGEPLPAAPARSLCELADAAGGGDLQRRRDQHASLWCQRAWVQAQERRGGPWQLFRAYATVRSYDLAVGLRGASRLVSSLPEDPAAALCTLLARRQLTGPAAVAYLRGLLSAGRGWTAHALWRTREEDDLRAVVELLALRACLDLLAAGDDPPPAATDAVFAEKVVPGGDDVVAAAPSDLGGALTPTTQATAAAGTASAGAVVAVALPQPREAGVPVRQDACVSEPASETDPRHVWQLAYELHYADQLLGALQEPARRLAVSTDGTGGGGSARRPVHGEGRHDPVEVQWVACIDVRSERLRRHLERRLDDKVETHGFAGFFGVDLDHRPAGGARFELCPAIIRPTVTSTTAPTPTSLRYALSAAVVAAARAPLTPLLLAEVAGPWAGAAAVGRTAAPAAWGRASSWWGATADPWGAPGLELEADPARRTALAAGALQGMGLTGRLAPLVVLCGHTASLQNNAYASAYDCGACGGSSGAVNARALAGLLNDPQVRADLVEAGIAVLDGTFFLAALHDTTTDDVVLDPLAVVPSDRAADVARLQDAVAQTTVGVRQERAATLPGLDAAGVGTSPGSGARRFNARAQDWAQPFPEWGLAGNAAIVVGPRALTRGLDLGGRVFLHSYDASTDPDGTLLEGLLTAPVIVAHWISSQYRASVVAPDVLGAGDKTTHNVVGDVGVLSGAHGDLRLGLPWQALFSSDPDLATDASRHEPMRLLVVVHASPEAVLTAVLRDTHVCELVRNGWLRVSSIDPGDGSICLLTRSLRWDAPSSASWRYAGGAGAAPSLS